MDKYSFMRKYADTREAAGFTDRYATGNEAIRFWEHVEEKFLDEASKIDAQDNALFIAGTTDQPLKTEDLLEEHYEPDDRGLTASDFLGDDAEFLLRDETEVPEALTGARAEAPEPEEDQGDLFPAEVDDPEYDTIEAQISGRMEHPMDVLMRAETAFDAVVENSEMVNEFIDDAALVLTDEDKMEKSEFDGPNWDEEGDDDMHEDDEINIFNDLDNTESIRERNPEPPRRIVKLSPTGKMLAHRIMAMTYAELLAFANDGLSDAGGDVLDDAHTLYEWAERNVTEE